MANRYKRVAIGAWEKAWAWEFTDGHCFYCGARLNPWIDISVKTRETGWRENKLNWDHVYPVSMGGTNDIANIVPACETCNLEKGTLHPHQWRWKFQNLHGQDFWCNRVPGLLDQRSELIGECRSRTDTEGERSKFNINRAIAQARLGVPIDVPDDPDQASAVRWQLGNMGYSPEWIEMVMSEKTQERDKERDAALVADFGEGPPNQSGDGEQERAA